MTEEIGEIWNEIKWVHDEKEIKKIEGMKRAEFEDFIGDMLYITLKIAYIFGIDSEKALKISLDDYDKRFPIEEVKGKHGNLNLGGVDKKYQEKLLSNYTKKLL